MDIPVGGAAADSRRAAQRLADAVAAGDGEEIKEAVFDQSAALINQSMTTVIPTLKVVLESVLKKEIAAISARLDERNTIDLTWRAEWRNLQDNQSDRIYTELDRLAAATEEAAESRKKYDQAIDDLRADHDILASRVDAIDARHTELDALHAWRIEVDQKLASVAQADRDDLHAKLARIEALIDQLPAQREAERIAERNRDEPS